MPAYDESLGDVALDRLRHVHDTFDEFDFPRESHNFTFSDTCIYWRRNEDPEKTTTPLREIG